MPAANAKSIRRVVRVIDATRNASSKKDMKFLFSEERARIARGVKHLLRDCAGCEHDCQPRLRRDLRRGRGLLAGLAGITHMLLLFGAEAHDVRVDAAGHLVGEKHCEVLVCESATAVGPEEQVDRDLSGVVA